MKAYVIEGKSAVVKEVPVPEIDDEGVLVKVKAVGINPTDYKHVDLGLAKDGAIVGCDFSGEVVKAGSKVPSSVIAVGDNVFGAVPGASTYTPERGAFAEYVKLPSYKLLFKLKSGKKLTSAAGTSLAPSQVNTFEGAASVGVPVATALIVYAYFNKFEIKKDAVQGKKLYLVWGGSSAVGATVIQFANWLGFRVIATASKKNFDLVKSYGAEAVFDYHDADVVDQIKKYSGDKVEYAVDTISLGPTKKQVHDAVSDTLPVHVAITLLYDVTKELDKPKSNIKYDFPLAYLAFDDKKQFGVGAPEIPSPPGLHEVAFKFYARVNDLWEDPELNFRHLPVRILRNGFADIPEALDVLRTGKNSGERVAVTGF